MHACACIFHETTISVVAMVSTSEQFHLTHIFSPSQLAIWLCLGDERRLNHHGLHLVIIPTIHNTKSLWCLSFAQFYCSYSCFLTCIPLAFHILQNEIFFFPQSLFLFLFYFFLLFVDLAFIIYAFLSLLIPTTRWNSPGIVSICTRLNCKQKKKQKKKKSSRKF